MRYPYKTAILLFSTTIAVCAPQAHATLVGDFIEIDYSQHVHALVTESHAFVVGSPDQTSHVGMWKLEIFDDAFRFEHMFPELVTYNTIQFTIRGLDWGGEGSLEDAFLVDTSLNAPGIVDLFLTDTALTLTFEPLKVSFLDPPTAFTIQLVPSHIAVSEPATLGLLVAGLLGLGFAKRRDTQCGF